MYDTLLTEIHGPVLLIRRNRPEVLNALNQKLMQELGRLPRKASA